MSRNGYMRAARIFAERAQQEFAKARLEMDDAGLRQAAEKGWGAAFQATKALVAKKGRKPSKGTTRLKETLLDLEKRDPALSRAKVFERFATFLGELHVNCFGEGDYSVKIIGRILDKLPDYIRTIESL
ncbi:MAG: hypothetical protein HYY13_00725 [Nitrospirae bacterium]|nr:hypothetical protein [Nitrospirota bacterium]